MNSKPLKSIDEAVEALGVSRTYTYRLIEEGQINRVHIGRRAFVTTASISAYIDRLSAPAASDDTRPDASAEELAG